MQRILLTTIMFIAMVCGADAQMIIGNCDTNSSDLNDQLISTGKNEKVGFATQFSRFKMQAYVGCSLTSVSIYSNGGECAGRVFVSTSLTGATALAEQRFQFSGSGWHEVVLDNPWPVTKSNVYIGYEFDASPTSIIVGAPALVQGSEFISNGNGWTAYNDGTGKFFATISGDKLPANDVALLNVDMPYLAATNQHIAPTATIVNLGAEKVESIEVSYHIDGSNKAQQATINGLDLDKRSSKTITLPELMFGNDGDHNIAVEVTAVNGGADAAPIDNISATTNLVVRNNLPKRKILLEVFSTERCTNCPAGHALINTLTEGKWDIIEMCHHAGFFTDQFTIDASVAYEWFYQTDDYSTSYAPAVMFNRTNMRAIDNKTYNMDSPLFDPTAKRLNTAYASLSTEPGRAAISISTAKEATEGQYHIDVDAEVVMLKSDEQNPVLNVFIVEDNIFSARQEGARGNYTHRQLVRACLTDTWGDAIDMRSKKIASSFTVDIPDDWKKEDLSVVAFVSNYDKKNNCNCEVLNAEYATLGKNSCDGIDEHLRDSAISTEYYTTAGIRTSGKVRGMVIAVSRNADGSIYKKTIINK